MSNEQLARCNGEVASIGYSKIDDPIGAGMEYHEACKSCARWAGKGSNLAANMQDFVRFKFLESEQSGTTCKNWLRQLQ